MLASIVEPRSGKIDPQCTPDAKFIGMEHVEPHTMRLLGTAPAESMKSGANLFKPQDVLYGRMRSYLNKVYQPDFSGLCSGEFIVMPESCAVLGRYLKYRLNAGDFVRFASRINAGDRPRVDFEQIGSFHILLPPRKEQIRIADALDELFSDLDAAVAALERVRKKLKLYRASVLKAAVEGKLTEDWRKKHPDAEPASELLKRILVERRRRWEEEQLRRFKEKNQEPPKNWKAKYKEPVPPETTNLPKLPDGWKWATLSQLLWLLRSGSSETSGRQATDFPVLKSSAVRQGSIDFGDLNYLTTAQSGRSENYLERGDVLVTRLSGSVEYVGCCAVVGALGYQGIQYPDRIFCGKLVEGTDGRFLVFCFRHPIPRARIEAAAKSTAGHQRISMSDLHPLPIPLPPLPEQSAIVEIVEAQLSVIDHLESEIEAQVRHAGTLRQAVLKRAFEGKLVPQNPNDEPASELLKRIAAERSAREAAALKAKQTEKSARNTKTGK
ncbi:MAG: restriction endonuclease subunit S [Candidatus Hydrogenedentes bacterium]|nr:restriction endonuclease subunit S [Candidatus Hydrogenedentota bacterium]